MEDQNKVRYLRARDLRLRYSVTHMTIHRWVRDKKVAFPQPMIVNRLRLWREDEIVAWERARVARRPTH